MNILLTGGTGSLGQALLPHLIDRYDRVAVLSRDEWKQSLLQRHYGDRIRLFLGDVRDRERVIRALHGMHLVIHAAALKRVDSLEYNPLEAVKTNILGTMNVLDAAIDSGVEKVLVISSDKASSPVTLYGATKLTAERLTIQSNCYSTRTRFSCVRYGNVVNSRGSALHLFREQRSRGEMITLTDPEMTRFWMTLSSASQFVLWAADNMKGGEVFIPKCRSFYVKDMASLHGPVVVTGIRPSEKLHESLISPDESRWARDIGLHYALFPEYNYWGGSEYGERVEAFSLSSDTAEKITKEELKGLVCDEHLFQESSGQL